MSEQTKFTTEERLGFARRAAGLVAEAGGRAYFVGGFVRDRVMGIPEGESPDIDIEVHGIAPDALCALLEPLTPLKKTGVSFGIYSVPGYAIDIAMPRTERATGRGHRDFETFVDPFLGPEKAAVRRDFTINAMMEDVLTGEILDFFCGRRDIENRILRHVNDDSFPEDPLRVLRAAQFSARFGFDVDEKTAALCSEIPLDTLSSERVEGEMKKALMMSSRPSVFFDFLGKIGQNGFWFPEAEALRGVPQNPAYHLEGDVWTHTMMVLDAAAALRDRAVRPYPFMLSALCHDFGKAVTTFEKDGVIHSYGHETAGIKIAGAFLSRIVGEKSVSSYVKNMVLTHMKPNVLFFAGASVKSTNKMFDQSVEPDDLLLIAEADSRGIIKPDNYRDARPFLEERLAIYREYVSRRAVTGADLAAAGIEPGPEYSELLAYSRKLLLAGIEFDSALKQTLAYARKMKIKKD